jgi:hypothetical protein
MARFERLRPIALAFWLFVALFASVLLCGEAEDAPEGADVEKASEEVDAKDETKQLLKQLTIAMTSEVIDDRTVVIRDTGGKAGKRTIHLRIGNAGSSPRGSLDDGEYAEKVKVSTEALAKLTDKQMIWYKAAPDTVQAPGSDGGEPDVVIADIWSIDGRHINTALKKDGHLAEVQEYEQPLGKDILTVAGEAEKKESYKKLEEALKESEKAKKEAAKAARAQQEQEEAENVEPIGLAGWLGIGSLLVILVGAFFNFGRPSNKKANLNRKKGMFEQFWTKMKGA